MKVCVNETRERKGASVGVWDVFSHNNDTDVWNATEITTVLHANKINSKKKDNLAKIPIYKSNGYNLQRAMGHPVWTEKQWKVAKPGKGAHIWLGQHREQQQQACCLVLSTWQYSQPQSRARACPGIFLSYWMMDGEAQIITVGSFLGWCSWEL